MTGGRLSSVDETYLAIEAPRTPLHVASLAIFEGGRLLDERGHFRLDEVRARIDARLGLLPRLRQRVATVPFDIGRPVWVDDEQFDIANHVDVVGLRKPANLETLLGFTEDLLMEPLDRSVPLWHFQFVTGLGDGRVALIERAHHAMVDGVSGVDISLVLLDSAADAPPPTDPEPWTPTAPPSSVALWADALRDLLVTPLFVAAQAVESFGNPAHVARRTTDIMAALRTAANGGIAAPRTSLNVPIGSRRRLSLLRYELADVKAAGASSGATVNDVMLTAVAGGLRALFVSRGEIVRSTQTVRALVPVSLRDPTETVELGNRVGALLTPVPVGIGDPNERLAAVSATTRSLKASTEAQAADALLRGVDMLPRWLTRFLRGAVHRQPLVNLVVTNVPGPPSPLYALGARMLEVYPLVPLGGNMSLEVAILSYDGALTVGITSDRETCPDVDVFADGMDRCFATLGVGREPASGLAAAVS